MSLLIKSENPIINTASVTRDGVDLETAVRMTEENNTGQIRQIKKTMDNSVMVLIISSLGIIATIIFNPKLISIERKVDENNRENVRQHEQLRTELKIIKTPDKLESLLRQMASNKLESCKPVLREFINKESENLIDVAKEIILCSFDYQTLSQSIIKLDLAKKDSIIDAGQFGTEFSNLYEQHTEIVTTKLKDDVSDIVLDEVYNSKQSRFSLACQVFLRDHLNGITEIYDKVNQA